MAPVKCVRWQICLIVLSVILGIVSSAKKVNFRVNTDYNCWNIESREVSTCVTANVENADLVLKGGAVDFVRNENGSKPLSEVNKIFFYNDLEEDNKNSIHFLPINDISEKFSTIEQLQCYRLRTKAINAEFFDGKPTKLKVFTFNAAKETVNVEANAFKNLQKLKKITMIHNTMIINPSAFVGLKDLEDLDLRYNHLQKVLAGWFKDLGALKGLDLSNNVIKVIEPGMLQNLNKLSNLNFEMNNCINGSFELTNPTPSEINSVLAACYPKESPIVIAITPRSISSIIKPNTALFTPRDLGACIVLPIPNGRLKNLENDALFEIGQEVDTNVKVKVECNKGFVLNVNREIDNEIGCSKNVFKKPLPKCVAVKASSKQQIKSTTPVTGRAQSSTTNRPSPKSTKASTTPASTTPASTTPASTTQTTTTSLAPVIETTEVPDITTVVPIIIENTNDPKTFDAIIALDEFCPGRYIVDHTMESECLQKFKKVDCDVASHEKGTEVTMQCKPGYGSVFNESISRSFCKSDGSWSEAAPVCRPACGSIDENSKSVAPWHVAIYRKDVYTCSGTIVSDRVVLTSAHCFHRQGRHSVELENKEIFKIVAGKYFRDIKDIEPLKTQTFGISELRMVDGYTGSIGYFVGNIAVVVLSSKIIFNDHISSICLDYDSKLSVKSQLPVGQTGMVAGWGWDKYNEKISNELKLLQMPIVSFQECKESAAEFEPFITTDKLCGGKPNGYDTCNGDIGNGLIFKKTVGETSSFYLRGIVSNSKFVPRSCDVLFYTLFTNVHSYIDMIKETVEDFS